MGMQNLDLIECNLGSPDWMFITNFLEQSLSIEIHYSTGVIGKNGTWILESDPTVHTDDTVLVGTYFTENVRYYPYPLGTSGPLIPIENYNNDGYYQSISMSYKTVTMDKNTNPDFKLELFLKKLVGKVSFSYDFYEDENLTLPAAVPRSNPYIIKEGLNSFNASNTLGSTTRFAVGRLSFLPGSKIELSSFKINDSQQLTPGSTPGSESLTIDSPPLPFVESLVDRIYYRSMSFQEINYADFEVEMSVQSTVGGVLFGYKHSNNANLIASTSIVSGNYTVRHGAVVPGPVSGCFVFTPGSSIVLTSFKMNGVEQLLNGPVAFETREPASEPDRVLKSEICFPAGTLVKTDQGLVEIQKLNKKLHTLQGKSIVSVTETYCLDDELVRIEKDALRKNYPNKDTILTKRHKIYYRGKMNMNTKLAVIACQATQFSVADPLDKGMMD
jgi:hypothetical protein